MENQGIIEVKEGFLTRLTNTLKKILFRGKTNELLLSEGKEGQQDSEKVKLIKNNSDYVQLEILDARRAYRKYVINNDKNVSNDVFAYIENRIHENEKEIKKLIEINNDQISFEDILDCLNNERKNVNQFKSKNQKTGRYNVPIGVIGIECTCAKDSIEGIFKAISTRNSIILLHNNYSKYSTEALVLLITKECLKNFYIDDNIVQMFGKEEIDLTRLDKVIYKNGENITRDTSKTIYIYQENDEFKNEVQNEIERLKNDDIYKSYKIKPIKGDFGNVVNYLNNKSSNASAVCMYTKNTQKAYKFINWTNSQNVFVNTGIKNCKGFNNSNNEFFEPKFVLHEDVF